MVRGGGSLFHFQASSFNRNPMRKHILFLLVACVLLACSEARAAKRVALVVGNGAYTASPLKNPVNDARDVASALGRLGFEVILKTDDG